MIEGIVFENRLNAELVQLKRALDQANEVAATVALDQSSIGRLSRTDALMQQAMAKGMRDRLLLRQKAIVAALARIDTSTFGQCCQCSADIEPDRLESDPATVFCYDCMVERAAR